MTPPTSKMGGTPLVPLVSSPVLCAAAVPDEESTNEAVVPTSVVLPSPVEPPVLEPASDPAGDAAPHAVAPSTMANTPIRRLITARLHGRGLHRASRARQDRSTTAQVPVNAAPGTHVTTRWHGMWRRPDDVVARTCDTTRQRENGLPSARHWRPMPTPRRLVLVTLISFASCVAEGEEPSPDDALRNDDPPEPYGPSLFGIAAIYHGVAIGEDGQALKFDAPQILGMQDKWLTIAAQAGGKALQARIAAQLADLQLLQLGTTETIAAHDRMIVDALANEDLATDIRRAGEQVATIASHVPGYGPSLWAANPALVSTLLKHSLLSPDVVLNPAIRERTLAYKEHCAKLDVPTPPDWPSDAWEPWAALPEERMNTLGTHFLSGEPIEVYWASDVEGDSPGVCVALPRMGGARVVTAMGIICQNSTTGNACFWDNLDPDGGVISAPLESIELRISDLATANTLRENCTECHRGDNVFMIHPHTPLYDLPDTASATWYTPVSTQPHWGNPPPLLAQGATNGCASCHSIPALNDTYCTRVLIPAMNRTMPPVGSPFPTTYPPTMAVALAADHGMLVTLCE
jgi:hypothetical protein